MQLSSPSRHGLAVLAVVVALLGVALVPAPVSAAQTGTVRSSGVSAYEGLGTWVDSFDYLPALQQNGALAPVDPESVADMAALGVRTLYLQVDRPAGAVAGTIAEEPLVDQFVTRAHAFGIAVVAWYVPLFDDLDADVVHLQTLQGLRFGVRSRDRFDAIALDLEWTRGVPVVEERSDRAVELAKQARQIVGGTALGAIVYPATQLEVLNPGLWPDFPYKRLARYVDVWLPMTYSTFRDGDLRDAGAYATDSVKRLRRNLDDKQALVHPIGGIANAMTREDNISFVTAARKFGAIGWSIYDYNTSSTPAWAHLRAASQAPA